MSTIDLWNIFCRSLPQHIVDENGTLGAALLDAIPDDLQAHKELQSKCAVDGQGNQYLYSLGGPFLDGEIQSDALTGRAAIAQIAKEAEQHVDQCDARHALAEHTANAEEVLGRLHIVFQRHDHTNGLHGEDGYGEEGGQRRQGDEGAFLDWRQILDQIVECDAQAQTHEDIGNHRNGRQVLEIGHPGNQDQWHEQYTDDYTRLNVASRPMHQHLLKVLGHDDRVDGTGAKIGEKQAKQYGKLCHGRKAAQTLWTLLECSLRDFRKCHLGATCLIVQLVTAFHLQINCINNLLR